MEEHREIIEGLMRSEGYTGRRKRRWPTISCRPRTGYAFGSAAIGLMPDSTRATRPLKPHYYALLEIF